MFKKVLFSIAMAGLLVQAAVAAPKVVGYYPYWAQYSQFHAKDVRFPFLTHVHYGYLVPSAQGDLSLADASDQVNFEELVSQAKAKGVKLLVTIGGPGNFEAVKAVAQSPEAAQAMAKSAKEWVQKYNLAGVELDWQGGAAEAQSMAMVVNGLQDGMSAVGGLLAISILGTKEAIEAAPIQELAKAAYVTVQFTDQMEAETATLQPNSNFQQVQEMLNQLAGRGLDKANILPVVPFYGKSFSGATGLGSSHSGTGSGNEGVLSYQELMQKFDGATYEVKYDDATQSEIAVGAGEAIVFNGIPSYKALASFVRESGFGGLAAYDLTNDHTEPVVSLLVTIGKELRPEVTYKKK